MIKGVLIKDIGLEIEVPHMSELGLRNFVQGIPGGWRGDHDGSTQSNLLGIKNSDRYFYFRSVPPKISGLVEPTVVGAELVSPIIRTDYTPNWKDELQGVVQHLQNENSFLDPKCSFHVHVNMTGVPVYILNNIINIWKALEAVIYRLSVAELGYHRGQVNRNFLYCRPLESPQVVVDGDHLRPSFDYRKLYSANSLAEFFTALGNTPTGRDPDKYNPVRYGGLNFFNYVKFGTVEFRTFNLTYNTRYMFAWIELCQAICKTAMGKPFVDYPDMLLGYNKDFPVELMQIMLNLTDETMITLYELFHMNDWIKFESPSWQFTHLPNNTAHWEGVSRKYIPESINEQPVRYYPFKNGEDYYIIKCPEDMRNMPAKKIKKEKPMYQNIPEVAQNWYNANPVPMPEEFVGNFIPDENREEED